MSAGGGDRKGGERKETVTFYLIAFVLCLNVP